MVFVLTSILSCKKLDNESAILEENMQQEKVKDTTNSVDKDVYGCLTSAGYMWSKTNKECIKVYEIAFYLTPKNNPTNELQTLNAYLIFDSSGNDAEIYLPNSIESKIFKRNKIEDPWIFEDWKLTKNNGFVLKRNNETLFVGDEEKGAKITGSDKYEK